MFNAVNKLSIAIIASFITLSIISSCGDSSRELAQQLRDRAESEIQSGNYKAALVLLDTLDQRYASHVDIRRSAMKFRAKAVEGLTITDIAVCDDSLATIKARLDHADDQFHYVKNPGRNLGGNYEAKDLSKTKNNILPRVNDDGYFTLSVIVPGRSIGLNAIRICTPNSDFTIAPIAADRVVRVENSEMTVLQQEDVASAIEWLEMHNNANAYELVGSKSTIRQKLSDNLLQAIISTWRYAQDRQAYASALILREKLERRLQLARNQLANAIDK